MEEGADEKSRLRCEHLRQREEMPLADIARSDALIADAACALPEFHGADLILSYCSFGKEVDTTRLIERALAQGKRVALPRVEAHRDMAWHEVRTLEGLVPSAVGILEPASEEATRLDIASLRDLSMLAVVPGLAFDRDGFRLGYGGGYYDRFLPTFFAVNGSAVGPCRESAFQEQPLPRDAHDVSVGIVVTEAGERVRHDRGERNVESL